MIPSITCLSFFYIILEYQRLQFFDLLTCDGPRAFLTSNKKDIITHERLKSELVGQRSRQMKMRTGGRPAHYTVQRGFVKKKRLFLATIRKARTATSLSGNQTEKFVSILRGDLDADLVEPGLHKDIVESNNILKDFFSKNR